jgi:hypothetical protein
MRKYPTGYECNNNDPLSNCDTLQNICYVTLSLSALMLSLIWLIVSAPGACTLKPFTVVIVTVLS